MSYVYVISEKGTNYYKLGLTKNRSENRCSQLQTGNPRDLIVLYEFSAPDRYAAEDDMKKQLARYKVDGGGDEWYQFESLDNLHLVVNRMVADRELALVSSYDGNVNYLKAILNSIDKWMVVAGLCAVLIPLLLFLVWSGAFLYG